MQAFDFPQVKLLTGVLKDTVNEMAAFYRAIPNDDILKYMREAAGLSAPGRYLTGWYAHSCGMGTLGQWVSTFEHWEDNYLLPFFFRLSILYNTI